MKDGKTILGEVLEHTDHTVNSFAKAIGLKRSQNLYDIESGKVKKISSELSEKIVASFPKINRLYLLSGEGSLLKENGDILKEPPSPYDSTGTMQQMLAVLSRIDANLIETRRSVELNQALSQANLYQSAKLEALQTKDNHHSVLERLNRVAAKIFEDNQNEMNPTSEVERG